MYKPVITIGPKVNQDDLGNGFYAPLGVKIPLDQEYRNKLEWLGAQCTTLPSAVTLVAVSSAGDVTEENNLTPVLPTAIIFGRDGGEFRLDAAMVGLMPHVARVELIRQFGGGDPTTVVMYTPPPPPQPDGKPSPIGDRWPEKDSFVGGNAYRPSIANPTAAPYKEGDTYQDETGSYRLVFLWWVFVKYPVWLKV